MTTSVDKVDPAAGLLQPIRIVLVHTTHPGNIGAVARAMKNMGMTELYLVQPKEYPSERAEWRASNARDTLAGAKVVETLDEAIQGCGLVVGTSARERRIPWPLFNPKECAEKALQEAARHQVALVFGREDRGLTNEELHKCHYHVHIPTNENYSSLNLAMAVQVLAYELRFAALNQAEINPTAVTWDIDLAPAEDVELLFEHLEEVMVAVGFHKRENPRQTMTRLRRLFNRVRMDQMEVSILRGFLAGVERKLKPDNQ